MSRSAVYDNWERLVVAVVDREHLRHLAFCDSFSSTSSSAASTSRLNSISSTSVSFSYAANELDPVTAPSFAPINNASTPNARGVAALLFTAPLAYYRRRRLRASDLFVSNYFFDVRVHQLDQLERFPLRELKVATDHFSNNNIIGVGGFGKVYKGRLSDGSLVAVKKIKEDDTGDIERQFRTEVKMKFIMGEHPNLLELRGFCLTPKERILIYPFIANHSVASCLRGGVPSQPPLDWATREQIALGSAKGLAYLHDQNIIHRDVKAANILLNEDFEAVVGDFGLSVFMNHEDAHFTSHFGPVICDFGLAKVIDPEVTHVTTGIVGTLGHMAPEYALLGKLTDKVDVYGYGIMLLELITGRTTFIHDEEMMILDWVKGLLKEDKLKAFVDVNLPGNYIDDNVEQFTRIAILCSHDSPEKRPEMSDVVRMLQGDDCLFERWMDYCLEQELLPQESNYAHYHTNSDSSMENSISSSLGEYEWSGE